MSEYEQTTAQPILGALTADEIRGFAPPTAEHGYDRGAVDAFLRVVADRYELALGKVRSFERFGAQSEHGNAELEQRERAIADALVAAQRAAQEVRAAAAERDTETIRNGAQAAADALLAESRQQAARFEEEAAQGRAGLEEELARLRSLTDSARSELVKFLRDALGRLDLAETEQPSAAQPARSRLLRR